MPEIPAEPDLVRIVGADGRHFTHRRDFAEQHGLKVLDEPGSTARGALPDSDAPAKSAPKKSAETAK